MIVRGIDPDLHTLPIVDLHITKLCVTRIDVFMLREKGETGPDAVIEMCAAVSCFEGFRPAISVVEGQQIYKGKTKNPTSILMLGQVAGACLTLPAGETMFPLPKEWKGDVPKSVNQLRTLMYLGVYSAFRKVGGKEPYWALRPHAPRLSLFDRMPTKMLQSDWKHTLDAVGLALWGARRAQLLKK